MGVKEQLRRARVSSCALLARPAVMSLLFRGVGVGAASHNAMSRYSAVREIFEGAEEFLSKAVEELIHQSRGAGVFLTVRNGRWLDVLAQFPQLHAEAVRVSRGAEEHGHYGDGVIDPLAVREASFYDARGPNKSDPNSLVGLRDFFELESWAEPMRTCGKKEEEEENEEEIVDTGAHPSAAGADILSNGSNFFPKKPPQHPEGMDPYPHLTDLEWIQQAVEVLIEEAVTMANEEGYHNHHSSSAGVLYHLWRVQGFPRSWVLKSFGGGIRGARPHWILELAGKGSEKRRELKILKGRGAAAFVLHSVIALKLADPGGDIDLRRVRASLTPLS